MKRLLLLGAPAAQNRFIESAKELGCYVAVVDYNENAPAIKCADQYYKCSLLDVEGIYEIAQDFQPDGISCGASDVGVITAAIVSNRLHLPGYEINTAYNVKDKECMIKCFEKFAVPHPEYQVISDSNEHIHISFPFVTKPIDSSASRGINIVNSEEEIKAAVEDSLFYSNNKKVIVEEYMNGPEVSVEIIVQKGEPYIVQITDKITTGKPHFIEIGHSQPSMLCEEDQKKIRHVAYQAVKAVGIIDGCAHAEIKLTSDGPKMVEIAGRLGGDFITTVLVPISTGINMAEYEVLRAVGMPKVFSYEDIKKNTAVAVRFLQAHPGKLRAVDFLCTSPGLLNSVKEFALEGKADICYSDSESNNNRIGYVIAIGQTPIEALNNCNSMLKLMKVIIK